MAARTLPLFGSPTFNSGWKAMGVWRTWPASQVSSKPTPIVLSVDPQVSGQTYTITARYRKQSGSYKFTGRWIIINDAIDGAHGCFLANDGSNLFLYKDLGNPFDLTGPAVLGTQNGFPLQNGQCKITRGTGTTSGDDFILSITAEFAAGFTGRKVVYGGAQQCQFDASMNCLTYQSSTWQPVGMLTFKTGGLVKISNSDVSNVQTLQARIWEPSSASGVLADGTRVWATSWNGYPRAPYPGPASTGAFVAVQVGDAFGGANWGGTTYSLPTVGGLVLHDVNLAFDNVTKRFVYVGLAVPSGGGGGDVYFGYSLGPNFSSWPAPVKVNTIDKLDYPSVAIQDGTPGQHRIVVGAFRALSGDNRFYTALSTNGGASFEPMQPLNPTPVSGVDKGPLSRVIWAGPSSSGSTPGPSRFHVFVPWNLSSSNQPRGIERWESTTGDGFTYGGLVIEFPDDAPDSGTASTYPDGTGALQEAQVFLAP